MTIFFVSRHAGALDWARRRGIAFDRHETHLDLAAVNPGDTVIGSLPINIAAAVCAKGAVYKHLSLALKAEDRGRELSASELENYEATLTEYEIRER